MCTYPFYFGQASVSSLRAEPGHVSSPQVQCMCNRRGKSCKEAYAALVANKYFANLNVSANIVNTCSLPEASVSHPRQAKAGAAGKQGATAACHGKHTSPRSCETARAIIARGRRQRHVTLFQQWRCVL